MKVLLTTYQGGIAGSTFSIFYLAKGLAAKGHEVHVAGKLDTELHRKVSQEPALRFHHIPFNSYVDLQSVATLATLVKAYQIEIINAQSGLDRTAVILARWFYKIPGAIVFTRRQRPRDEPWLKRWFHLSAVKRIVLVSEGVRELFIKKGYPAEKLITINNGVSPEIVSSVEDHRISALKEELKLTGPVIGCVSRLKKQAQLVAALSFLPENLTVLFVGIERSQLKAAIHTHKPKQRLIFTGRLPRHEALAYYRLMDVKVLPSEDGFGLVLVEAMLFGVPVIGTNKAGIKYVIEDRVSGLLYKDGDVKHLAENIRKVLDDPDLRNRLIKNGHQRAKYFSMDQTVNNYEKLFHALLIE